MNHIINNLPNGNDEYYSEHEEKTNDFTHREDPKQSKKAIISAYF